PFASIQLFIQAILAGGSDQLQREVLPAICTGSIGTVALFESDGDWRLEQMQASAVADGEGVRLSGSKILVCDRLQADYILVSVSSSGGPALALVPSASIPRGQIKREVVIDETRRAFSVDLTGIRVPAASLITGEKALAALKAIRETALLL